MSYEDAVKAAGDAYVDTELAAWNNYVDRAIALDNAYDYAIAMINANPAFDGAGYIDAVANGEGNSNGPVVKAYKTPLEQIKAQRQLENELSMQLSGMDVRSRTKEFAQELEVLVEKAKPVVTVAASLMPTVGEMMDVVVLVDQNSTTFEKTMAGFSLLLSVATCGATPNFGALARAGNRAVGNTVDVTRAASHASDLRILNNIPTGNNQTVMNAAAESAKGKDVLGITRAIPQHQEVPWYKPMKPQYEAKIKMKISENHPHYQNTLQHETQHAKDIVNHPQITYMATKSKLPGSGLARYWLEYRGYAAGGDATPASAALRSFSTKQKVGLISDIIIFGGGAIWGGYNIWDLINGE